MTYLEVGAQHRLTVRRLDDSPTESFMRATSRATLNITYARSLAGMRAWRSVRGNAQFLRRSGRDISSATHGSLRGSSIATILSRDEPIENAEVKGWIRSVRKQKKIAFAALGDGSTLDSLQAVLKPEQVEQ